MREEAKRCYFFLWLCGAYFNTELITHTFHFHCLQVMNHLYHTVLLSSHFWVTNPKLLCKPSKPKLCSLLLLRVIKADMLLFDQTTTAEDFRIIIRKHLPFTTFFFNLQATTLLTLKTDTLGITIPCFF